MRRRRPFCAPVAGAPLMRSEEHTSELQSRELISYAVFCLKKKTPSSFPTPEQSMKPTPFRLAWTGDFQGSDGSPRFRDVGLSVLDFFLHDARSTYIYTSSHTLSLHDALPI